MDQLRFMLSSVRPSDPDKAHSTRGSFSAASPPKISSVMGKQAAAYAKIAAGRARCAPKAVTNLYPEIDQLLPTRSGDGPLPLTNTEIETYQKVKYSATTTLVRKSHLAKILQFLRREFPDECQGLTDKEVLTNFVSPAHVDRVAACFATAGIATGGAYLSTWASEPGVNMSVEADNMRKKHLEIWHVERRCSLL